MTVEKDIQDIGLKPVDGQNFLNSSTVIEALVESGEVEDKDVLEIGAGTGEITERLSEDVKKVSAVEKDFSLVNFLKKRFKDHENVNVVESDIFDYSISEFDRCVSNLPFQHSSDILDLLGEEQIQSSLILQEDLVDKVIAEPGESSYGERSVKVKYYFIPVKLRKVGSENFYPQPDVDAAILKLYPNKERHGIREEEDFFLVTKALFTHKRKKVRNAFVDSRNILGIDKDEAKEIRDDLPHSEERVINLEVRELGEISEYLNERKVLK